MVNKKIYTLGLLTAAIFAPVQLYAEPPWKLEILENREGRKAYQSGDYEKARDHFRRAKRTVDGDDESRADFNRGAALFGAERFAEAEQAFESATRTNDDGLRADAFFNRGLALEGQTKTKEAIESYRQALLTNPNHEPARNNLERLLLMPPPPPEPQQGENEQADSGEDQNEQSGAEQDKEQAGENPDSEGEQNADAGEGQDETPGPNEPGEEDEAPRETAAEASDKLTDEEVERILRAAELESARPNLRQSGEPPPDYEPAKDW